MNTIVIAIPSYNRPDILCNKTLATLETLLDSWDNTYIFVADEEQKVIYLSALGGKERGKIIVGVKGMAAVRNFMTSYFPEKQRILYLDDDINGFVKKDGIAKVDITKEEFNSFVQRGFQECEKSNTSLWGVYPIANGFFMKDNITTDLRYIVGCCYGVINDRTVKVEIDSGEDYQRTILFFEKYGSVVRINFIAPKTVYWCKSGGMSNSRTIETMQVSCDYLIEKWPQYCSLKIRKTGNLPVIRFKRGY